MHAKEMLRFGFVMPCKRKYEINIHIFTNLRPSDLIVHAQSVSLFSVLFLGVALTPFGRSLFLSLSLSLTLTLSLYRLIRLPAYRLCYLLMSMLPRIICRVRAIYPFHSEDPASLNFNKGDYIDVLAQLDSGWWDGWYVNEAWQMECVYYMSSSKLYISVAGVEVHEGGFQATMLKLSMTRRSMKNLQQQLLSEHIAKWC